MQSDLGERDWKSWTLNTLKTKIMLSKLRLNAHESADKVIAVITCSYDIQSVCFLLHDVEMAMPLCTRNYLAKERLIKHFRHYIVLK